MRGGDVLGFCASSLGTTTAGTWNRVLQASAEGMPLGATVGVSLSGDGTKLYVGGVGDQIQVYDAATLAHVKDIFAGGDFMATPVAVPRAAATPSGNTRGTFSSNPPPVMCASPFTGKALISARSGFT